MAERSVVMAAVSDTYSDSVRRGFYSTADQFFLSLMYDDRIERTVFADHPRGVASQIKRRIAGDRPAPRTRHLSGIRPLTIRTSLPPEDDSVRRRYRAYDAQLSLHLTRMRIHRPVLVTFNLWHAAYGDHRRYSDVIFYTQDDEREIPRLQHLGSRLDNAYAKIATSGMTVCAVSKSLLDRIAPTGEGLVIPNGVDPALWASAAASRPQTSSRPRPIAAYAGTIDTRLDVAAVSSLAAAGFDVQLAGPVLPSVAESLASVDGVRLVGNLSREDLVRFLGQADLCFLAHRRTPLTESMSPLKIYEYCCTQRPVVATALDGIVGDPELSGLITCVRDGEDFGDVSRRALRAAEATPRAASPIDQFSWRTRHRPLIDRIVDA